MTCLGRGMTHRELSRLLAAIVALPALANCYPPCTDRVTDTTSQPDHATACEIIEHVGDSMAGLTAAFCQSICADPRMTCSLDTAYLQAFQLANEAGGSGGGGGGGDGSSKYVCPAETPTVTCSLFESAADLCVSGRRPAGLSDPRVDGTAIGAYLATSAHLEAASILAFQILRAELSALGAPRDLLEAALSAETDEVRHTAMMTRIAAKYGALVPELEVASAGSRSAVAIAVENMIEGVVRETFGAAIALFQADHAADPELRAAMRAIAVDECAHASLAFRTAKFLDGHLDAADRARVEAGKHEAMRGLFASLVEPEATLRRLVGLPSVAESRQMLEVMVLALWTAPLAA